MQENCPRLDRFSKTFLGFFYTVVKHFKPLFIRENVIFQIRGDKVFNPNFFNHFIFLGWRLSLPIGYSYDSGWKKDNKLLDICQLLQPDLTFCLALSHYVVTSWRFYEWITSKVWASKWAKYRRYTLSSVGLWVLHWKEHFGGCCRLLIKPMVVGWHVQWSHNGVTFRSPPSFSRRDASFIITHFITFSAACQTI